MTTLVFEITDLEITKPKRGSGVTLQNLSLDIRDWIHMGGIRTSSCVIDDTNRFTTVIVNAKGNPKPENVQPRIEQCLEDTPGVSFAGCRYVPQRSHAGTSMVR